MYEMRCIITILERGKADRVVEAAKKAGATGATIFYGRGTGESEVQRFLSINIEASKEVIMILANKSEVSTIVEAMTVAGDLDEPGKGITFTMPVAHIRGLNHRDDFVDEE